MCRTISIFTITMLTKMIPRFLKLSNILINTNYIYKLTHHDNTYYIHTATYPSFSGFFFWAFGNISSNDDTHIRVCEKFHPQDYIAVKEWAEKQ